MQGAEKSARIRKMSQIYVGIDISKEKLDVAFRPTGEFLQFRNDEEGIEELKGRLLCLPVAIVVMEASGGYERLFFAILSLSGIPCSLVNPKRVREFAKSTGKLAKTDKIDAFILAWYGEAIKPKVTSLSDGRVQEIRELIERREQKVKMKKAESNRLDRAFGKVRESILLVLFCLEERQKEIEREIEAKLKGVEEVREKVELLMSMKGVGKITALTFAVKLPEMGKVSQKKIASLV
ncbi:MAG: transposase [Armatimonadetes bacterium]|nr:transposase [Armatimonadota bacterium]